MTRPAWLDRQRSVKPIIDYSRLGRKLSEAEMEEILVQVREAKKLREAFPDEPKIQRDRAYNYLEERDDQLGY